MSRICLNMIVKNEASVIERCLASVLDFIDSWAIVDTGSTDGTQQIIQRVLKHVPGELIERPWVDFATNRNEALQAARRFGDYALFLDADDVLEVDDPQALKHLDGPLLTIESNVRGVSGWNQFMARLDIDWHWQGVLHEILVASATYEEVKLHGVRIRRLNDGARTRIGAREKYARDAQVLKQAMLAEPDNARYALYLGHSLRESGQHLEAIAAYEHRSDLGGEPEEVYVAKLMVATLREHTGAQYSEVADAYLRAYRFRPSRAEAPAQFAHYLLGQRQFKMAADFASIACQTPMTQDSLLVNQNAYGWRPWDDLAIALFELREFDRCAQVCRRLSADERVPPDQRERIARNLAQAEMALSSSAGK